MYKLKRKYTTFITLFLLSISMVILQSRPSQANAWDKIMEGVHYNKSIDKSFGGTAGGKFYGNAYVDLDVLPPYGKAGVFAEGSVFIKDVHTWKIIKAEGFVEGGLKIATAHDASTDEIVVTFTAGTDAVVDLDFLSTQIYYFNANETRVKNNQKPLKKSWETRFDISPLNPALELVGKALGIGKSGALQLLADALTETTKALIKNTLTKNGQELTTDEKFKNITKVLANQVYKVISLRLQTMKRDTIKSLLQKNYSPLEIIMAAKTGQANGELGKITAFDKKMKAVNEIYIAINQFLTPSSNGGANGTKIGLGKEYKWEKKLPGYSQTFMVGGIVPVSVEFGGSAGIGAKWEAGVQFASKNNGGNNFFIEVGPFVDAGAYASAALNVIIFKAGIEGTLDLIRDDLTVKLQSPFPKVWTDLSGSLNNKLSTVNGKMSAFVSWKELKFYKKNICKNRLVAYWAKKRGYYWRLVRWRWRKRYFTYYVLRTKWVYGCKKETRFGLVTKKKSTTLFNIKGPSWTIQYPIFKFEDPRMPVINVSDSGEFSSDLF